MPTTPDQPSLPPRMTGLLGVFFVNTQVTIYIKALARGVDSMLMAEAAALALAAAVNDRLNFSNTSFLSDCQQVGSIPKCYRPNQSSRLDNQVLHSAICQLLT